MEFCVFFLFHGKQQKEIIGKLCTRPSLSFIQYFFFFITAAAKAETTKENLVWFFSGWSKNWLLYLSGVTNLKCPVIKLLGGSCALEWTKYIVVDINYYLWSFHLIMEKVLILHNRNVNPLELCIAAQIELKLISSLWDIKSLSIVLSKSVLRPLAIIGLSFSWFWCCQSIWSDFCSRVKQL